MTSSLLRLMAGTPYRGGLRLVGPIRSPRTLNPDQPLVSTLRRVGTELRVLRDRRMRTFAFTGMPSTQMACKPVSARECLRRFRIIRTSMIRAPIRPNLLLFPTYLFHASRHTYREKDTTFAASAALFSDLVATKQAPPSLVGPVPFRHFSAKVGGWSGLARHRPVHQVPQVGRPRRRVQVLQLLVHALNAVPQD